MNFDIGVIVVALSVIAVLLTVHFLTMSEPELHDEMTRLEKRYIEPEVKVAQQVEAKVLSDIETDELYLKAGIKKINP